MVRVRGDLCYARAMTPMERPMWMVPRVSRWAEGICAGAHLGAAALCLVVWPWTPALCVAVALLCAGGRAGVSLLRALPHAFVAVLLAADGRWLLTDRRGERHAATLDGKPLVTPWFVIVPFRVRDRRYCWVAGRDTVPVETLRRLRLRLRFGPAARATTS